MITLSNLSPNPGSRKVRKRIGRGQGSGHGKTATRGHKGANARSGNGARPGFEGGQMPLQRRLPKRGFTNVFKKQYGIVNLADLNRFDDGTTVDRDLLVQKRMIAGKYKLVKVLADGNIDRALTLVVDKVSAAARQKIEAAGGSFRAVERRPE